MTGNGYNSWTAAQLIAGDEWRQSAMTNAERHRLGREVGIDTGGASGPVAVARLVVAGLASGAGDLVRRLVRGTGSRGLVGKTADAAITTGR
jgi:hypothetical protein